jgi:hypothetical protein
MRLESTRLPVNYLAPAFSSHPRKDDLAEGRRDSVALKYRVGFNCVALAGLHLISGAVLSPTLERDRHEKQLEYQSYE